MRKRTRSREFALQILYQADINRAEISSILEDFWKDRTDPALSGEEKKQVDRDKKEPDIRQYAESLVRGTLGNVESIDRTIERFTENWEIKRMSYVDRNILRLSAYEICFSGEIPAKVAINEAVELAKRYGEPDSSKCVNGILDKIAKSECKP